jgi:hypothetical protein
MYLFLVIMLSSLIIAVAIGIIIYFIMERKNKHIKHTYVGGCGSTRWGCCKDGLTPKYDQAGTNCVDSTVNTSTKFPQYSSSCNGSILNCNNFSNNSNVIESET